MSKCVYVKDGSLIVHTRYITESFNKVVVKDKNNPDKRLKRLWRATNEDP